jgi:hypothetical protein
MGINQLTAFGTNPPARTFFVTNNAGQQQSTSLTGGALTLTLPASNTAGTTSRAFTIPAGNWIVQAGQYSNVQIWDQQSYFWRYLTAFDQIPYFVSSDGTNARIINTTGGVVGAVVTNVGTANTAVPNGFYGYDKYNNFVVIQNGTANTALSTATAPVSATTTQGGLLNVFIGGSISTTITVVNGTTASSGYTQAPQVIVVPPANQGAQPYIPATVKAVLTGGAISSLTVINQGAGYVAAPTLQIVNAPGDTTGALNTTTFTLTLVNTNQLAAVTVAFPGNQTYTSAPTITMSGTQTITSAAATAICNLVVTAVAANAAGAGYGTSIPWIPVWSGGGVTATQAATATNPAIQTQLINPPLAPLFTVTTSAGGVPAAPAAISFNGYGYATTPVLKALQGAGNSTYQTTDATWTVTMGGIDDTVFLTAL